MCISAVSLTCKFFVLSLRPFWIGHLWKNQQLRFRVSKCVDQKSIHDSWEQSLIITAMWRRRKEGKINYILKSILLRRERFFALESRKNLPFRSTRRNRDITLHVCIWYISLHLRRSSLHAILNRIRRSGRKKKIKLAYSYVIPNAITIIIIEKHNGKSNKCI